MESGSNKIYRNGKPGWFWPLLLLLLVIGWLTFYLKCCSGIYGGSAEACVKKCCKDGAKTEANHVGDAEEHAEVSSAISAGELDANGNFIINTGSDVSIKLADGSSMTVGENSTENKLYTFLNDESIKVSEDKGKDWITMDRVYFETGKAVLTAESQNQLKNISAILNNYPSTQIKMGGYTDQTGPTEVNVKVSGERANSAMASLVALGVDGSRVAAEGYGPEHPVCTTDDSPECLAQNRRVDIRVKSK